MNQDTKNAMIGMTLIMVILFGWQYLSAPSAQQVAENKRIKDSTEQATRRIDSLKMALSGNFSELEPLPLQLRRASAPVQPNRYRYQSPFH